MTDERKIEVLGTLVKIKKEMQNVIKKESDTIRWATNHIKEIDKMMIMMKGKDNGN